MNRDAKHVLTEYQVLQAQNGSEAAFRELYALWHGDLQRYLTAKLGSTAAAEEVAQEAWIDLARSLSRLDDPGAFARWAFQIAARRAADWIRRQQRDRRHLTAWEANPEAVLPVAERAPDALGESEEQAALRAALQQLPAATREVLHLFYHAEFSIAAIAETLDLPPGTVKSRLFAARAQLKQQLENLPL